MCPLQRIIASRPLGSERTDLIRHQELRAIRSVVDRAALRMVAHAIAAEGAVDVQVVGFGGGDFHVGEVDGEGGDVGAIAAVISVVDPGTEDVVDPVVVVGAAVGDFTDDAGGVDAWA